MSEKINTDVEIIKKLKEMSENLIVNHYPSIIKEIKGFNNLYYMDTDTIFFKDLSSKLSWKDRIAMAMKTDKFTKEDIKLADNAKTSLISELNLDITLLFDYESEDIYKERIQILKNMKELDFDFLIAVMNNWIVQAMEVYIRMQMEYEILMKTVSD
jgi:hypothetical protein